MHFAFKLSAFRSEWHYNVNVNVNVNVNALLLLPEITKQSLCVPFTPSHWNIVPLILPAMFSAVAALLCELRLSTRLSSTTALYILWIYFVYLGPWGEMFRKHFSINVLSVGKTTCQLPESMPKVKT